jgi:hypothetical protein
MRDQRALICASALALATLGDLSVAQATRSALDTPDSSPTSGTAMYDPRQFPVIRGEVQQFTLTTRGDIDGLVLKDGTEVKTAPALSTQVAFAVKPGDTIAIHGLRAAAIPLVRAVSITDEASHRTVIDTDSTPGSPPPPLGPARAPAPGRNTLSEQAGRVRMVLHGLQGEVNGVLLESGAIWRFPPNAVDQVSSLLQPRESLVAEGVTVTNNLGTVVDVQEIGPTRDRLVAVGQAPPPPADDRGPRNGRRDPLPPLGPGPAAPVTPPSAGFGPGPAVPPAPPSK